MNPLLRGLGLGAFLLALWHGIVVLTGLPPYMLPAPRAVLEAAFTHRAALLGASLYTLAEIVAGFMLGVAAGMALALFMAMMPQLGRLLRPVLLILQVIPIFALAPILTLWLGYGMAPKIVVVALICGFPVALAFLDGLERAPAAYLDLAQMLGARRHLLLWHMRIPLALPHLGTGLNLAALYAPVGAVIGEWVGGAQGLGAMMIQANGRMRIDLLFAALALVVAIALGFHALIRCLTRALNRFSAA